MYVHVQWQWHVLRALHTTLNLFFSSCGKEKEETMIVTVEMRAKTAKRPETEVMCIFLCREAVVKGMLVM